MTQKIDDGDAVFQMLLDNFPIQKRLAGLTPEQVLSTVPIEQRLAGLTRDQQPLALSDDVLRTLPDAFLRTFSAETQAAIRRRIGEPTPDA
jgi:hypothetical protein